jgi:hypothetical protein
MPGRRGTIVLACAAALAAAAPAGALAQAPSTTCASPPTAPATSSTAPAATSSTAPAPASTTQAQPAADNGREVPLGVIVAGAILLAALALWGFARWWAWEPPWLDRWRHATAEAGWRASAAWAEFTDWLRLGR